MSRTKEQKPRLRGRGLLAKSDSVPSPDGGFVLGGTKRPPKGRRTVGTEEATDVVCYCQGHFLPISPLVPRQFAFAALPTMLRGRWPLIGLLARKHCLEKQLNIHKERGRGLKARCAGEIKDNISREISPNCSVQEMGSHLGKIHK